MIDEKNSKNITEEKPEKDVALEVNLSLSTFSETRRVSGIVALFANCGYMLSENQKGFGSNEQYWEYIAQCGNASATGNKVNEGG